MPVKWGVLGTANIAKGCTIPGMKKAGNCDLYAIAGRNEEKTQSYKQEFGFAKAYVGYDKLDRKSTRLNSSHTDSSRMPSSA